MTDKDPAILREWDILSQLPDEALETFAAVHIFGATGGPDPPVSLGALLLSTDDQVLYVGATSDVKVKDGTAGHGLFQVEEGQLKDQIQLEGKTIKFNGTDDTEVAKARMLKMYALSGVEIMKLRGSNHFCVAITTQKNLLLWGEPSSTVPDSAFVFYELHTPNTYCSQDCGCYYKYKTIGNLRLQYCSECGVFCPIQDVVVSPDRQASVVKLVRFKEEVISCTTCNKRCTKCTIGGMDVNFCQSCNQFPQITSRFLLSSEIKIGPPRVIKLGSSVKIVDIDTGHRFFVALTSDNNLIFWGGVADQYVHKGILYNPDNGIVKSFSCGRDHVAVVSVRGELYTCGLGEQGRLGYEWTPEMGYTTLRKVPLTNAVTKVCCGYSSTVCLMADGSLMCFGSNMKMLSTGVLTLNQSAEDFVTEPARIMDTKTFTDVINSPLTNIYVATTASLTFTWGREKNVSSCLELVEGGGDLMEALANLPASFTFKTPVTQQSTLSPHLNSSLYGQDFLSDLTLKLSDGDFPVHRLILLANSTYFQDIFAKTDLDTTLDMTHYNPETYKCLLKYFYEVPPTELKATDLFDLYVLATSYWENGIAQEVFDKLKSNLNEETVLSIIRKASEVNCSEVLDECNSFITSPEFKHVLAEKVSQDMTKTLSLLESLDK